jgi:hypothetical protein
LATRKVQEVPQGLQNAAEWIVESLRDFLGGILGAKLARETFWFFATVFLFHVGQLVRARPLPVSRIGLDRAIPREWGLARISRPSPRAPMPTST